jgi:hypothetical protein
MWPYPTTYFVARENNFTKNVPGGPFEILTRHFPNTNLYTSPQKIV